MKCIPTPVLPSFSDSSPSSAAAAALRLGEQHVFLRERVLRVTPRKEEDPGASLDPEIRLGASFLTAAPLLRTPKIQKQTPLHP